MTGLTQALLLLLFTILILFALAGNILVVAAVFVDRKLRIQPENLYLVSLALSDLAVSLLVMIFAAANDLLGFWPFGATYCKFWICFDIICCTASILNLCAISFDRYLHISRPLIYSRFSSKRLIIIVILIIWMLSALIGLAQYIFSLTGNNDVPLNSGTFDLHGKHVTHNFSSLSSSSGEKCQLTLQPLYAIVSSFLSFFLPATVMVMLYTKIYLYARMHVRSIRAQLKQATSLLIMQLASERIRQVTHVALNFDNTTEDVNSNKSLSVHADENYNVELSPKLMPKPQKRTSASRSVSDQKARVTLGVIMGTFLICWLPFFVVNIWRSLKPNFFPLYVFQVVTWLGYANSTANPVIYGIFNRDFRMAFTRVVKKLFWCPNSDKNHNRCNGYKL